MPESNPPPPVVRNAYLSEKAAYSMVIGCMLIAMAMILLLFYQTYHLNKNPNIISLENAMQTSIDVPESVQRKDSSLGRIWLAEDLDASEAAKIALEYDAQFLRTKRAQSLVSSRLFIQSIAILAGVTLLGMGSSFVFARINTPQASSVNYEGKDGGKLVLASYSPGLFLALLGTIIICAALIASVKSKTKTVDTPVFLEWPQGMRSHLIMEAQKEANGKDAMKKKAEENANKSAEIMKLLEDK